MSAPVRCVVLGGGGHARVVIDSLQSAGGCEVHGVLDPALPGGQVLGVPVLGGDELMPALGGQGVEWFVVGFGGVRDNQPRMRMFERARAAGLRPLTVMHPSSVVSRHASIGAGTQVLPAVLINAGAVLGENVIVNSGAIVEHDCVIGDHVHIAPGACLAAAVRVGAGAHIGAGATIRQGITIGARAVVGLGAVVVADVPEGETVAGVPARPLERRHR